MQKELSAVEEAESQISKQLVDIKHHLQRAEARVSESQKKIKMWKKEVSVRDNSMTSLITIDRLIK